MGITAGPLIICFDPEAARGYEALLKAFGPMVARDRASLRDLPLSHFGLILADVNLTDPEIVLELKKRFKEQPPQKLVFVVEPKSRAALVQAAALGSTKVLNRPIRDADLEPFTETLPKSGFAGQVSLRAPRAPDLVAAEKGADSLKSMFGSLVSGGRLDMEAVRAAGRTITGVVAEKGLDRWLSTVREHHTGTYQHCLLVAGVTAAFSDALNLPEADRTLLAEGAMVHDIGKIRVPRELLDKPAKLSDAEFAVVKKHPGYGYDYLKTKAKLPEEVLDMVLHHHEFLDGSGYPDGLTESKIRDHVKILTICDIYGALMEQRSYKLPLTGPKAYGILKSMAAEGKIDRFMVDAFAPVVDAKVA